MRSLAPCTLLLLFPCSSSAQLSELTDILIPAYAGESTFVSVAATKDSADAQVFVALNASDSFQIGSLAELNLTKQSTGVIIGVESKTTQGVATPVWQSVATSPKAVTFTDITIIPRTNASDEGLVAVCGYFGESITFSNISKDGSVSLPNGLTLNGGSGSHGFYALFDEENGTWISAFITPSLLPTTITSADSDSVVVAGQGTLAARYQIADGALSWKTLPESLSSIPSEISSIPGGSIAVLYEDNLLPEEKGIHILTLENSTGKTIWSQSMGGLGQDTASGMEVSENGHIHLAFHSQKGDGTLLAEDSAIYLAAITDQGTFEWINLITYQANGGKSSDFIQNSALTTDSRGSTWLACYGLGNWQIGNLDEAISLSYNAVYVKIDAVGKITEFFKNKEIDGFVGLSNAMASANDDRFFAVGDFENNSFLTSFRIIPGQELYTIYPTVKNNGKTKFNQLHSIIKGVGARAYVEIDEDSASSVTSFISAWLVEEQFNTLNSNKKIIVEKETFLHSSGYTLDASESLRLIGSAYSPDTTYNFPETENPVRLYLIDTAVANPGDWIGQNPNLQFEETRLMRASGDPHRSISFKHGTQILSTIAGSKTGVSPGTPISVVNFDIYPDGETTTATLISAAVYEAVGHYQDADPQIPSAICIASSSGDPASSYALSSAIEFAIEEGLTVIVSAGNHGKDASAYIPAAYGALDGVICTGAVDSSAALLTSSNIGDCVDIYSPGKNILTIDDISSKSLIPMTGTSPAAGFTAGIVLTELSASGTRAPAIIEKTLKTYAKTFSSDLFILQATVAAKIYEPTTETESPASPPLSLTNGVSEKSSLSYEPSLLSASAPAVDSDMDGTPNILETFHGSDSDDSSSIPIAPAITLSEAAEILFTFRIASGLFDPENALSLSNGQKWGIQCSTNMTDWTIPDGTLSAEEDKDGITWVTASIPSENTSCFIRLVVTEPSAKP